MFNTTWPHLFWKIFVNFLTSTLLRAQNTMLLSKVRRRFFQILWPSQKTQTLLFIENSRIGFTYDQILGNFDLLLGFTEFQIIIKNEAVKKDFLCYSVLTFQWLSFARRTAAAATRKLSSRTRKVGKIGASLDSRLMYWIPILYFFPLSAFGWHNENKSFLERHSKN